MQASENLNTNLNTSRSGHLAGCWRYQVRYQVERNASISARKRGQAGSPGSGTCAVRLRKSAAPHTAVGIWTGSYLLAGDDSGRPCQPRLPIWGCLPRQIEHRGLDLLPRWLVCSCEPRNHCRRDFSHEAPVFLSRVQPKFAVDVLHRDVFQTAFAKGCLHKSRCRTPEQSRRPRGQRRHLDVLVDCTHNRRGPLKTLRELAKRNGQISAAVAAEVKRGELMGYYVQRRESTNTVYAISDTPLSADEWTAKYCVGPSVGQKH